MAEYSDNIYDTIWVIRGEQGALFNTRAEAAKWIASQVTPEKYTQAVLLQNGFWLVTEINNGC